jgi:transcriptional regulator with XRE-family HTH domain
LGDHIRATRLDRGLRLEDVANEIDVTGPMISLWEMNRSVPMVSKMPAIVRFLGYTPYRAPKLFGEWLRLVRTANGYSRQAFAQKLDINEGTVAKWERDESRATTRMVSRLRGLRVEK